jgi:beta-galactosidase
MPTQSIRQTLSLDAGWLFHLGDVPSPLPPTHIAAYMANKAGWARGAAGPNFDDSDWPSVDLPHDWSVEGKLDPANHLSNGYLPRGVGWYRRYFRLEESDRGKYLALRFDGVATHCTVFVNGHVVHRNFCGYTPFTIDISDIATFGEQLNVIAVHVDATSVEGWWYEGAGIYRHVWLEKRPLVQIAPDGLFVHTEQLEEHKWSTHLEMMVRNCSNDRVECELVTEIAYSRDDLFDVFAQTKSYFILDPGSSRLCHHAPRLKNPALWSPDNPNLHEVSVNLFVGGKLIDWAGTYYGYRTIRFDPEQGFLLNGKPIKLLGTCNHQDHAGVGVAVPDSIHEFRIRRLKDMGCNAYRCAHNPPAPELLDACDRLGMLVMDENRSFGSSPEHLEQLRTMVRRDRNHPGVICWSLCNEEAMQGTPTAANIARTMMAAVKQLDPSRPVTAAVSGGLLNDNCIADSIEVVGMNYQLNLYDPFHAKHPTTPLLAAETHCAYSTRGEYETNKDRRVFASYDTEHAPWGATARQTWRAISSRPFVAGLFIWTGFDYRGEPTPHEWPSVSTHWGILDTCGFAKDAFYLHKAWFTKEPEFVHLLPHWNWPGREGQPIRVMAFTNCDSVELSLNDRVIGARSNVDRIEMVEWSVPYEPGRLKAVGYRRGEIVASATVETTGDAVALGLEIHPSFDAATIPADAAFAVPITVFAIDAQNRRVPTANHRIDFALTGPGRILGVGNGDPNCHAPDKASSRSLFNGLAQVIVQTTSVAGGIVLEACTSGLRPAILRMISTPADRSSLSPAKRRHFITDWRMSRITPDRPDVNQAIAEQDMNSWERIDPAAGPHQAWAASGGYAIYRATFTPPKSMQTRGGRIVLHEVIGAAEVSIDGVKTASKPALTPGPIEIQRSPADGPATISILLASNGGSPAGLSRGVEMIPG